MEHHKAGIMVHYSIRLGELMKKNVYLCLGRIRFASVSPLVVIVTKVRLGGFSSSRSDTKQRGGLYVTERPLTIWSAGNCEMEAVYRQSRRLLFSLNQQCMNWHAGNRRKCHFLELDTVDRQRLPVLDVSLPGRC